MKSKILILFLLVISLFFCACGQTSSSFATGNTQTTQSAVVSTPVPTPVPGMKDTPLWPFVGCKSVQDVWDLNGKSSLLVQDDSQYFKNSCSTGYRGVKFMDVSGIAEFEMRWDVSDKREIIEMKWRVEDLSSQETIKYGSQIENYMTSLFGEPKVGEYSYVPTSRTWTDPDYYQYNFNYTDTVIWMNCKFSYPSDEPVPLPSE